MSGAAGSNECPAGSVRIETEPACRAAATAAGKTPASPFVGAYSVEPRGCFYGTGNNVAYFNTHAVGAGNSNAQLLCAVAAPGAPSSSALSGTGERTLRAALGGTSDGNRGTLGGDEQHGQCVCERRGDNGSSLGTPGLGLRA